MSHDQTHEPSPRPDVAGPANESDRDHDTVKRARRRWRAALYALKKLPPPVGVALVACGIVAMPLPGPLGAPLVLAGGMILAPKRLMRIERSLAGRFPKSHRAVVELIERFAADYEKRFSADCTGR